MPGYDWLGEIVLICATLFGVIYGLKRGLRQGWKRGKEKDEQDSN